MIFNSISKEINRKASFQHHNHPINYPTFNNSSQRNSYFPQRPLYDQPLLHSNNNYLPHYQHPQNRSAISQMNQKLAQNIQYIRYKDAVRNSHLKSSRISSQSNGSVKSNRSSRSNNIRNAHLHSSSHLQPSFAIKTVESQHYFPTRQSAEQPNWNSKINPISSSYIPGDTEELKYFHRKPITIESSSNINPTTFHKYPPQTDQNHNNNRNKYSTKVSQFFDITKEEKNIRQTPTNLNQHNSHLRVDKSALKLSEQIQINNSVPKQQTTSTTLSPLDERGSKKDGIIVAAVLIALGILLFLVQTLK